MDNEQLEQSMRYARSVPSETPEGLPINSDIKVLAAEVERLQKLVADQALTIGMLRDGLARERSVDADWKTTAATLRGQLALANEDAKLRREEAQTSRLALDVATREVEQLRSRVLWFESRERDLAQAKIE